MTYKQTAYITKLLETREYVRNADIDAFNSGMNLSAKQASNIIEYLQNCEYVGKRATDAQLSYIQFLDNTRKHDGDDNVYMMMYYATPADELTMSNAQDAIDYLLSCEELN